MSASTGLTRRHSDCRASRIRQLFLEAARRLDVQPSRAMLFEDALVGVEAGERGGFGCVIGIDHGQQRGSLRQHGADIVIKSLREVNVE